MEDTKPKIKFYSRLFTVITSCLWNSPLWWLWEVLHWNKDSFRWPSDFVQIYKTSVLTEPKKQALWYAWVIKVYMRS